MAEGSDAGPESAETDAATAPGESAATDGDAVRVRLPEAVDAWVDERVADDPDRDREDVVRELIAAYRRLEDDRPYEDLRDRLESQRAEYVELVEDVRERVVELGRELETANGETSGEAPDPGAVADLRRRLDDLEGRLDEFEQRVDAGFENYETVLREVTNAVDDLGDRLDALATTVAEDDGGDELDRLRRAANEAGVRTATCEDCGATLEVALLTAPECPHCRSRFVDVRDDGGLLGSPTLVVEDPPALGGSPQGGDRT